MIKYISPNTICDKVYWICLDKESFYPQSVHIYEYDRDLDMLLVSYDGTDNEWVDSNIICSEPLFESEIMANIYSIERLMDKECLYNLFFVESRIVRLKELCNNQLPHHPMIRFNQLSHVIYDIKKI